MSVGRKNIMLGTAGHVDHGKTALVKLLTGCETDILAEEKERGLTIDLGFAPCRLADKRIVGVVDVPGHVDFIRNMVAGAHGVDVVILVVAADDGIMPQTREHLHILTLMGLKHGLVALTKIDLVEPSRRAEVQADLHGLLAGTFLAEAPICPISNITGEGFDRFFDALNRVVAACDPRPESGLFRVWVEDVFTLRGPGTVITGIPSSGVVRTGDQLFLLPSGREGHVRRMQVYGEDSQEGRAGECVALNVPELGHEEVRRGMVLCASDLLQPVSMVEAEFRVLQGLRGKVEDFVEVHMHVGTGAVRANVAMLEGTEMLPGEGQMVQLRMAEPLAIAPGERFVLRANVSAEGQSGLVTIGGGRVLGASNARLRRRKQWTLNALAARRDALDDPRRWCEVILQEAPGPLEMLELQRACVMPASELAGLVDQLAKEGLAVKVPSGSLTHLSCVERAAAEVMRAVENFHNENPQRGGLESLSLVGLRGQNPEICQAAIEVLLKSGKLERSGTVLAKAGWAARLSSPERQLAERVDTVFRAAGFAAPAAADVSASLRIPVAQIEKLIQVLCERGILVRVEPRIVIHRDAVEAAKTIALKLFSAQPSFSTMEFRDGLAVSRKYAVPILDYLDKVRFTVRNGHDRTPGVEARKLLPAKPGSSAPATAPRPSV